MQFADRIGGSKSSDNRARLSSQSDGSQGGGVGRKMMRWRHIRRPAQDASVSFFGAEFGFSFRTDRIATGVEPADALLTLDDQIWLVVLSRTDRTVTQ